MQKAVEKIRKNKLNHSMIPIILRAYNPESLNSLVFYSIFRELIVYTREGVSSASRN